MSLVLQNISAGYDGKTVVRDVSLTVPAGQLCALLGLNGSGKTTLLKAILGLIPMTGGSCNTPRKHISYIPQRHSDLAGVSVMDVVLMGFYSKLGVLEFPSAADKERARGALTQVGLDRFTGEDFSRLSEGQKQMVILARALVQDASVMLMDEPDSALDFMNRRWMLTEVRRLVRSDGRAGLVTLHDPGVALRFCDWLFLMRDGTVVGRLEVAGAGREEAERCLGLIYEGVRVAEVDGRFYVLV